MTQDEKSRQLQELTNAEEEVMHVMWKIRKGFVNDVLVHFPEPRPAYNTISTIIRILEKKGYISHTAYGKTHEYFPLVQKEDYSKRLLGSYLHSYFDNSYKNMLSFFTGKADISVKEMEEIQKMITEQIENKKNSGNE